MIKDERAKGLIKRMKKFVEKPEVWEALDLNKTRGLNGMFNLHKYDLFDLSKYFQFDEVHSKDYFQSALEQALLKEEATDMVTNFKKISLTNNKIVKNNMTEQQCSLEQRILQRKLKKRIYIYIYIYIHRTTFSANRRRNEDNKEKSEFKAK